jgi:hypothetical protein
LLYFDKQQLEDEKKNFFFKLKNKYIQTTRAFPVIPKKKISAYNDINVTIIGSRFSSGIVVVVLIVIDEVLVGLVILIEISLGLRSTAIME